MACASMRNVAEATNRRVSNLGTIPIASRAQMASVLPRDSIFRVAAPLFTVGVPTANALRAFRISRTGVPTTISAAMGLVSGADATRIDRLHPAMIPLDQCVLQG